MDPYSLWCKVVTGIHNLENKPAFYLSNKNIPGVWNNIANVKKDLQKYGIHVKDIFKQVVRSENKTSFWHHI